MNTDFNKQAVIDIVREIKESKIEDNIFETTFTYNEAHNFLYYKM